MELVFIWLVVLTSHREPSIESDGSNRGGGEDKACVREPVMGDTAQPTHGRITYMHAWIDRYVGTNDQPEDCLSKHLTKWPDSR